MGGKKQQAQRTKNNTRPSSSSRSAEILGGVIPSFVGFSTAKDGGIIPILPGFSVKEEIDPNIDPNFQLVLKKFGKKDCTTKLKALNEFTSLVNMSEESTVCAALSLWPRYYGQLSTDVEHRIREAAQVAHGAIAQKCGRSMAPYLKQLAPIWITSQYDTYVPAAMQAQAALQIVFPPTKLPEVLSFCKMEILSYISDNLIFHSPNTLSNPKTNTPEECEAKYERVIISSLQGYALLISNIPESQLEWLCTEQGKILDNAKFWNYGSHKIPQIRTSCYAVLGSLCQRLGSWFAPKYGNKASQLLLTQLNEKELNVTISVWENAIILMANIPEWWKLIDLDAGVLPTICETLGAGGWGSAGRMAPLLLPLLAHLSASTLSQQFYDAFFEAVLKGAEQRCVVSSKSECSAWVGGLAECLRYVSVGANDCDYTIQSLSRALRLWLTYICRSHISINPFTPLKVSIGYLSDLIRFWTKQSLSSQNPNLYAQLLRLFWKNVFFVITSQLEKVNPEDDFKEMTDLHRELLSGLKTATHVKPKKVTRVKFDSDQNKSEHSDAEMKSSSSLEASQDANIKQIYERELFSTVNDVCGMYLQLAKSKNISAPILGPLHSLILDFESQQLFNIMLHAVLKENKNATIFNLYSDIFFNWMKGDFMRSQAVVDLTFTLFNYLNELEQREVLKTFDQLPLSTLKWCIQRCLSHPHSSRTPVREWLQGDLVHQSIVSMTHLVVKEGDRHHATLLKMCFAQDNNGVILINEKSCSSIISILAESLSHHDWGHLDMCASFASQLASSLCTDEANYQGIEELLLSLFILNCNVEGGSDRLSHDTWWEVNTSWQDALSTFSWEKLINFTERASDVVFSKLVKENSTPTNKESLNTLVDLSLNLLCACVDTTDLVNSDFEKLCTGIEIIMKLKSEKLQTCFSNALTEALTADILNGRLDAQFAGKLTVLKTVIENSDKNIYNELTDNQLQNYLEWLLFCTKLMDKILTNAVKSSDPNDSDEESVCDAVVSQNFFDDANRSIELKNILSNLLYNIAIAKTLYKEYQGWHWYLILVDYYKIIEETASHAIKSLSNENYFSVLSFIKTKADEEGMYWSICLQLCSSTLKGSDRKFDLNLYLKNSIQMLCKMEDLKAICEYSKENISHSLHILNPSTSFTQETDLNLSGILAVRAIYLSTSKKLAQMVSSITKEDFIACSTSPISSLSLIIDKYYLCKDLMLYDMNFSSASWEIISCNASIVRFLTACVQTNGWQLEAHHWDFITITLSSLMQSIDKSKRSLNTTKVSYLAIETFKLFCAVDTFIHNIPAECIRREPTPCIANLPQEWVDIFAPDIHLHLMEIFIFFLGDCISSEHKSSKDVFFFHSLYDVMLKFSTKYLVSNQTHSFDLLMSICLDVLSSPCMHILKYIAHKMLKNITPSLVEADKASANSTYADGEEEMKPLDLSVYKMVNALNQLQECTIAVLSPYSVGEDNCILLPYTDSYNMTLGYLLLWETMMNISQESVTVLQYQYTEFFREGKYVENLICALFRLLAADLQQNSVDYFKNPPELLTKEPPCPELISGLACARLAQSLRVGAVHFTIRGWWGALPARTASYVEKIVRAYVSPILIGQQLAEVGRMQKELPNVEFSIHPSTNEVFCKYIVDNNKMELTIELCGNHPLGIPRVTSSGGPSNNVAWIAMFLSRQNGTLWQTIILWLNSIQRKLDSATECYICYCKLHPVTGKLPKITCHTCKNKSHLVCLKKWFSTSQNTTCPMCRAQMTIK